MLLHQFIPILQNIKHRLPRLRISRIRDDININRFALLLFRAVESDVDL